MQNVEMEHGESFVPTESEPSSVKFQVGELMLQSERGMMTGYLNAECKDFVDGWFRTGDVGRVDEDGLVSPT